MLCLRQLIFSSNECLDTYWELQTTPSFAPPITLKSEPLLSFRLDGPTYREPVCSQSESWGFEGGKVWDTLHHSVRPSNMIDAKKPGVYRIRHPQQEG
ncbi:hypothetical protein VTK73DRAFT_4618 [Phialemonium thermophilum]|uniref:Uncharacterized protein n=1 Tax=Phialemonium thermophilum TaxID=223376 RepID=A0ABR3WSF9_9PEZI